MSVAVLPLGFLKNGQSGVISDCAGGLNIRRRLSELGLVRGSAIKVINNDFGGPLIISLANERLAIGRGISLKIMVEEVR